MHRLWYIRTLRPGSLPPHLVSKHTLHTLIIRKHSIHKFSQFMFSLPCPVRVKADKLPRSKDRIDQIRARRRSGAEDGRVPKLLP